MKEELQRVFIDRLIKTTRERFSLPSEKLHGLRRKISNATGINQNTVQKWFYGSMPDAEQLVTIYRTLGTSPNYLLGIDDEEKLRLQRLPIPILQLADFIDVKQPLRREDFVTVPLVAGRIAATLGSGILVDEQIEDWAIIHRSITGRKKNLISIRVDKRDGMSMFPILKPGDIVIIDKDDRVDIKSTGIYAIRIDEACTVKRVQIVEHQLLLIPENKDPVYKISFVDLRTHPSPIIGRLIWGGREL